MCESVRASRLHTSFAPKMLPDVGRSATFWNILAFFSVVDTRRM